MQNAVLMANYNRWVNEHIYELCSSLTTEQCKLDRKIFFGSIHNTLNHILLVDILWLDRLVGAPTEHIHSLDQVLYADLTELRSQHFKHDMKLVEYTQTLDTEKLSESVNYRRMNGNAGEETVQQILWTLFNHQTHHRGQVHAMLSQSGLKNSEFPDLDVVDFLADTSAVH